MIHAKTLALACGPGAGEPRANCKGPAGKLPFKLIQIVVPSPRAGPSVTTSNSKIPASRIDAAICNQRAMINQATGIKNYA
jgi:hypothetical protein